MLERLIVFLIRKQNHKKREQFFLVSMDGHMEDLFLWQKNVGLKGK